MASSVDNITALIKQAEAHRASGNTEAARQLYLTVLAQVPDEEFCTLGLGICARQVGHHDQALEFHRRAHVSHPLSVWPHIEAAEDYFALKRWDEADWEWRAALRLQPSQPNAVLGLVRLARVRGDLTTGLAVLEAQPAPDESIVLEHSRLLNELGRNEEALSLLGRGASQFPHNPEFLIESAYIMRYSGDLAAARAALEEAAAVDPQNPKALLKLSDFARQAHDHQAALGYLKRAKEHCAPDIWVGLCLSQVLFELGRYDECEAALDGASAQDQAQFQFTQVRAEFLMRRGRIAEAQAAVADARAHAPAHPALTLLAAELAHRAGDLGYAAICAASIRGAQGELRARQLYLQATIAEETSHRDAAMALYQAAETAQPSHRGAVGAQVPLALLAADLPLAERKLLQWSNFEMPDRRARGLPAHVSQSFLGQFYEEHTFEPEALAKLRAIMSEPAAARLPWHLEFAAKFADWTPAAIALLLALREAGLLSRPGVEAVPSAAPPRIPQRIVQYWYAREPPTDIIELMDSWRSFHPDWHYQRFDDATARDWLDRHAPSALKAYVGTQDLAQKSDVLRLAVLMHEGGWYADADDRCRAPLASLPTGQADFVAYQEEYATLGNNVLGARAGHPVIATALNDALMALEQRDADIIWLSTGPGLLTRSFARALRAHEPGWADFLCHVAILTRPELRRAVATHCHCHYKLAGQHWGDTQFSRSGLPGEKNDPASRRASIRLRPR